jgi:IS30 family transposase
MKKKPNKTTHLTYEDRVTIEALLRDKRSYQHIATNLTRGKSTIAEEVKRNGGKKKYRAKKAHARAYRKQYRKKRSCNKVATSRFLTRFVEKSLRLGWSPERITSRLRFLKTKRNEIEYASAKSIRKYIQKRSGLEAFLFWRRMKKKPGIKRGSWIHDATRRFIDSMPEIQGFGHFEVDFIVSSKSTAVLLVLVDVITKLTLVRTLPHRVNTEVNTAIVDMLSPYNVHTLIPDNDIAFGALDVVEKETGATVYFARPYKSNDKPLVENTNRWIRAMGIPKKTDISTVSPEHVSLIQDWCNNTPRECLGGMTPMEKIAELEGRAMIIENYPKHPTISPMSGLKAFVFGG